MVNQQYQNADLFRSTEPVTLALPIPRIEIVRYWSRGTGFAKSEKPMWRVSPVGLNGQPLPKEDEVPMRDEAEHIAEQWNALLGWPIVRTKRVVQTTLIYELEAEDACD